MSPTISLPPHLAVEATLVADKSYRVRDLRTGARLVLRFCPGAKALVQRRVDALAGIAAPDVVAERELVEDGGRSFTLRPWIEGRPLDLAASDPTSLVDLLAAALEPLHAAGIAHGRIHAGNVIRAEQGRLYLVDAADPLPGLDDSGALHAAPEQLRGEAPSVRTDVYATGLLAFEACTGRRPFVGAPWVELARRALYEGVDFTFEEERRLDPNVVAALRRALALEPTARCASLRELVGAQRPPAAPSIPEQVPARPMPPLHMPDSRGPGWFSPPAAANEARSAPASNRGLRRLQAATPYVHHVATIVGRVSATARSTVSPRLLARVGAAVSLVGASAAALVLVTGGGLEREVATLIQQSDYGQASAVLAAARREGAAPALVEKLEGDLDCAQGSPMDCLQHYAHALEDDPDLASDDTLRTNTLAAFDHADRSWLVAKVAAKLDGADDELLQYATDKRYWARWNAVRALEERGMEDRIPYGAVYGLDVLHAGTCSTRQRSLGKLIQGGQVEARPYLQQAKAKADGKLFGDWCLGSDLDTAIRRIESQR